MGFNHVDVDEVHLVGEGGLRVVGLRGKGVQARRAGLVLTSGIGAEHQQNRFAPQKLRESTDVPIQIRE